MSQNASIGHRKPPKRDSGKLLAKILGLRLRKWTPALPILAEFKGKCGKSITHVFTWTWCSLCKGAAVVCPICGNHLCTATYGNDGACKFCELGYQYQTAITDMRLAPSRARINRAGGMLVMHSQMKLIKRRKKIRYEDPHSR